MAPWLLDALRCQAPEEDSYESEETEAYSGTEGSVSQHSRQHYQGYSGVRDLRASSTILEDPQDSRMKKWRATSSMSSIARRNRARSDSSMFRLRTRTDSHLALRFAEGEDESGDEEVWSGDLEQSTKPREKKPCFGLDPSRHVYPVLLFLSLVGGAFCVSLVQAGLLAQLLGCERDLLAAAFEVLYALVILDMLYVGFADPGQYWGDEDHPAAMPRRSHKNFMYERPVLRFDHYCRWVTNVIGLRNHREFVVMLFGFMAIAWIGIIMDVMILCDLFLRDETPRDSEFWVTAVLIFVHLLYSVGFAHLVRPILVLHVGFVSRNELGNEWKHDRFYSVPNRLTGELVWVAELDEEEFDERYDEFVYDPSRNPWDQGSCAANCWLFWCTPRCPKDQLGEF